MSLSLKDLRNKKKKVEGRRSIVKADSRSAREIPEEILVEILVRLPADSLLRFKCVSMIWSSLISSRYFTNLFFKFSSSTKRERVFVYTNEYRLFSSSLSNLDPTTSFIQLNHDLTLPGMEDRLEFVNAIRGLICFEKGRAIQIINFTTRQVLRLPLVESNILMESTMEMKSSIWNYFGYDPVNDEYKVLNTISKELRGRVRFETQVWVLGAGDSWRNTRSRISPPPHRPYGQGISINGVLYYTAWSHEKRSVLMSFDLNCEEFNLFKFPIGIEIPIFLSGCLDIVNLMNYQSQLAVFDGSRLHTECILDLWVLEDVVKSKWSHKVFVSPCHQLRLSLNIDYVKIRGTDRSGEIILSERNGRNKKTTLAIYNLERNCITSGVVIEPKSTNMRYLETTLWHDVESIIYLEA